MQTFQIHTKEKREATGDLFGIFFEDINHAADGGLYAELIQNRAFEFDPIDNKKYHALYAWMPCQLDEKNGQADAADVSLTILTDSPYTKKNPHYLRITANSAAAGVKNLGFNSGIALEGGETYHFSCYLRKVDEPVTVKACLIGKEGQIYASCELTADASDWNEEMISSFCEEYSKLESVTYTKIVSNDVTLLNCICSKQSLTTLCIYNPAHDNSQKLAIEGLKKLSPNLTSLTIYGLSAVKSLKDDTNLLDCTNLSHITLSCPTLSDVDGISALTNLSWLVLDYCYQLKELGDIANILAYISIGDRIQDIERLVGALADIKRLYSKDPASMLNTEYINPKVLVSPQTAFYSEKTRLPIRETSGRICAEFVMCYPPGIPILAPGELITDEIIEYVLYAKEKGCSMQGTEDPAVEYLNVL